MRKILPNQEKISIINRVLNNKEDVTSVAKDSGVSRKAIYQWINLYKNSANRNKTSCLLPKYREGKSHPLDKTFDVKNDLLRMVTANPLWTIRDYAAEFTKKGISICPSTIYKILKKLSIETPDRREHFAKSYSGPGRLSTDLKVEVVNQVLTFNKKISDVSRDYGISRKVIYKWINDFKKVEDSGILLREALSEKYIKGADHPKYLGDKFAQQVLFTVRKNPGLAIREIAKNANASEWTTWRTLKENNLNSKEQRFIYAQKFIPYIEDKPSFVYSAEAPKTQLDQLTPNLLPGPPPPFTINKNLLHIFAFSTISALSLGLIYWFTSDLSHSYSAVQFIGMMFAGVALLMGLIFLLYSIKYYLSVGMVLSYSGDEAGKKIANSSFRNLIQRVLGLKVQYETGKTNAAGLLPNLDHVSLKNMPFVSVHIPYYNEKNVVRRSIEAAVNFNYPNYEIVLADDSTDETTQIIRDYQNKQLLAGETLRETKGDGWTLTQVEVKPGIILKHLHRTTRSGFKGEALDLALKLSNAKTEFVSVFDADFVPYPDSLELFLKYFKVQNNMSEDYTLSNVAAVQGYQWHVLNKSENWITRGVRSEYAGSYVVERSGAEIYGGLKQISGSVYMIRRDVLEAVGWGASITEDFELTLRLYEKGYKVLYTPYIQAPSECVSTIKRLVRQRMRWAEGHSFNIKKMFTRIILSPNLTFLEKVEFAYLSPYYLQAFLLIVGTFAWFTAEVIFRVRLPFWTELWGWSLIITNFLALPLLNAVGLFIEESGEKDYAGLGSFVALSYLLVPFQAYASLKGFMEDEEGTWFRTPKSGRITDIFTRGKFYRFITGILPGKNPSLEVGVSDRENYLSIETSNTKFSGFSLKRSKNKRVFGKAALAFCLIITLITGNLFQLENAGNMNVSFATPANLNVFSAGQFIEPKTQFDSKDTPNFKFKVKNDSGKGIFSFLGPKTAYGADLPTATLLYKDQPVEGDPTHITQEADGTYSISVSPLKFFRPGKYRLVTKFIKNGKEELSSQDFRWGVIALNTEKSVYAPNEDVNFGFGVVDDAGRTICNADLILTVTVPSEGNKEYILSTVNGGIKQSGQCGRDNVTNTADYLATFKAKNAEEKYTLDLIAKTYNGKNEVSDSLTISKEIPFVVNRSSYPTRIYPKSVYPVSINIVPTEDFKGKITENLPAGFDAIKISDKGTISFGGLMDYEDKRQITWNVNWKKGENHTLSYTVLFPMISPEFYLIGPMTFTDKSGKEVFKEYKPWQVAADAIAVVQARQGTNGSAAATVALAFASNNTAGNLIVTTVHGANSGRTYTPTDSQGNTYNTAANNDDASTSQTIKTSYAMNINGGANTVTWTVSSNATMWMGIVEYSGLDTTSALDQNTVGKDGSATTTHTSAGLTTTQADEVLYGGWHPGNTTTSTWTAQNSYTIEGTSQSRFTQEDRIVSSTGTYTTDINTNTTVVGQYTFATFIMAAVPEHYQWYFFLTPLLSPIFLLLGRRRRKNKT